MAEARRNVKASDRPAQSTHKERKRRARRLGFDQGVLQGHDRAQIGDVPSLDVFADAAAILAVQVLMRQKVAALFHGQGG